jgi:hypothetical protein
MSGLLHKKSLFFSSELCPNEIKVESKLVGDNGIPVLSLQHVSFFISRKAAKRLRILAPKRLCVFRLHF